MKQVFEELCSDPVVVSWAIGTVFICVMIVGLSYFIQ